MEDDKKTSTTIEETQTDVVENVQREAELLTEETTEQEQEVVAEEPVAAQEEETPDVTPVVETPKEGSEEPQLIEVSDSEPVVETETGSVEASDNDSDEDEENDEDHHEENIYSSVELDNADKATLLDWLKKISKEDNIRKIDRLFKDLGTHFEAIFEEEKKVALEAFLAIEGNTEEDFEFKGDEIDRTFNDLYENVRHKRSHFYNQLEKLKEENLARKTEILDLIREAVDGEDQTSFNKVKKLQEEWKRIGQVPGAQNRTLWANYHALMDRFYDQRSIYFELKELDRKKNLETKIEIVEKAEALDASKDVKTAIIALNELHDEFKHIGPVPREDQEPLWQRFKAASDKVYEHRKEFTEQQKELQKKNLQAKSDLAEKVTAFSSFNSDRIKDWNQKTKQLLELQKQWEAVGSVPREKAKDINHAFWGGFKQFFANKNKFFKSLDSQREDNLKKKRELVEKAKEAKESKEWDATTKLFKNLQNDWKEIGPVPEKFRKSIYEEFKAYCDEFFNRKRGLNAEQEKEFTENLNKKNTILNTLEELSKADQINVDEVFDYAQHFASAGMVPRNAVGKTLDRYDKIAKKIISSPSLSDDEVSELKMHFEICKLRNSPHGNQKINRKEHILKRKITGLENDISNWKNNLDFFAASKNADQLKADFIQKIEAAEQELDQLKQQLRLMRD